MPEFVSQKDTNWRLDMLEPRAADTLLNCTTMHTAELSKRCMRLRAQEGSGRQRRYRQVGKHRHWPQQRDWFEHGLVDGQEGGHRRRCERPGAGPGNRRRDKLSGRARHGSVDFSPRARQLREQRRWAETGK